MEQSRRCRLAQGTKLRRRNRIATPAKGFDLRSSEVHDAFAAGSTRRAAFGGVSFLTGCSCQLVLTG